MLDFAIWLQHVATHKFSLLWRLHRVHHADLDIDVTTALRFHPIEIALSMLYKILWVLILGPAAFAVILFEVILNGCAMFNHANLRLPSRLDSVLRTLIVTPAMHHIHHSILPEEHHSILASTIDLGSPVRNLCLGSKNENGDITIGLPDYQGKEPTQLCYSLMMPFQDETKDTG